MQENKVWIITKSRNIYHEGDERSRTHPGHGYPAYTETVEDIARFISYDAFFVEVTRLMRHGDKFLAYEAKLLRVTATVSVDVEVT